ncbi:Cation/H+ exchanger [Penicillium concentricum]|uniref:ribonuclease H n=1 Tax=Penicillium concentricum TaxID=293559 RepID=A0A9W9VIC8_9EURO|nr:Cation/H+ exchanger [Penicillium concentricum]KAJ5383363.1 Cation/H+ exchanger [Penicillium concentricum]
MNKTTPSPSPVPKASPGSKPSPSPAAGTKRKRNAAAKYYAVKAGHKPGIYYGWDECLAQITGFKGAIFQSFPSQEEANAFLNGIKLPAASQSSENARFYGIQRGRVTGVYTDWTTAQEQIRGFPRPRYRKFSTREEAEEFVREGQTQPPVGFGAATGPSGPHGITTEKPKDAEGVEFAPGDGPLPTGAEDGFDPNVLLDPATGKVVYKTAPQMAATKTQSTGIPGMLRIYTDGSSLRNGTPLASAGVGVFFGPGDSSRNVSEPLKGSRQTNQRAELTAILRAIDIAPRHRDVTIITDSRYSIDCVTVWFINWRRNNWMTRDKKPVENKDLVESILIKIEERNDLKIEWRSLGLLLGPGMAAMWMCSSLVIWAMVPNFKFLHALIIGACVTPTDPVLSNSIVKGKFADKHVPRELQRIIIAESGANDGLGYPFLFFAIYLVQYTGIGSQSYSGGAGKAMALWFYETWVYTILLSVVYGTLVGWIARKLLHWAEEKRYVDRESFLVFAIALALFIVGTCGLIGTDDLLACFIAGNVFTQDDWFRLETMDDSLQPTIDMLLNLSVFMWFGAVCPWSSFLNNSVIPIHRLIFLGILVLLVRRLPIVFAMHKWIPQIELVSQAAFVGFFGPIGVGAIFYLSVSLEFLRKIQVDGEVPEDVKQIMETIQVVVWFLVVCSIVVHGLSVPIGKAGYNLPATISSVISTSAYEGPEPVPISNTSHTHSTATPLTTGEDASYRSRKRGFRGANLRPPFFGIGGSVIRPRSPSHQPGVGQPDEPERPVHLVQPSEPERPINVGIDQTRGGDNKP